ncbi:uncharacterized protein LOC144119831 [Amblyomma americanum]
MDAVRVLAQARKKIKKIKESRRDVGIWKQLMLWNLLQNWSWLSPSESEEVGGGKEKGGPKASDKKSATRNPSNKERKATKRLREEYEDEPWPTKKFQPNQTSGDGEEAGPSGLCKGTAGADPLNIKLTRADSPNGKKEKEQRPAEEKPED